jgi:hypothetical protein
LSLVSRVLDGSGLKDAIAFYGSLQLPACSCVSITLPASSNHGLRLFNPISGCLCRL